MNYNKNSLKKRPIRGGFFRGLAGWGKAFAGFLTGLFISPFLFYKFLFYFYSIIVAFFMPTYPIYKDFFKLF